MSASCTCQCEVGEPRGYEFSVGETVDVEDDEAVEEVGLLPDDRGPGEESPVVRHQRHVLLGCDKLCLVVVLFLYRVVQLNFTPEIEVF